MGSSAEAGAETVKISVMAWWKRLESYLWRLPLLTKAVVFAIIFARFLEMCGVPLNGMWALDPEKMDLSQSMWFLRLRVYKNGADGGVVHRLNTYILIHANLIHMALNLIAVTPLLERFEREIGTLKTTLLVAGRELSPYGGFYGRTDAGWR